MDAVINALPISMHCEWTVKAAEAGKHILCEKPLATSAKDCKRMIDAARSNNVVLVEGFTHRWNPHLRKARELVADGAIGQVVTVNAVGCSHRTRPADYESIRYSAELRRRCAAGGRLLRPCMRQGSFSVQSRSVSMGSASTPAGGVSTRHSAASWSSGTGCWPT